MLNPELMEQLHQAVRGMERDEVVAQVAACDHAPANPEGFADYLIEMSSGEGNPGNPY